jgi:hypothetical protein
MDEKQCKSCKKCKMGRKIAGVKQIISYERVEEIAVNYEQGLDRLKQQVNASSWSSEFALYEARLRENLNVERLYGTNEQCRSDRARIVAHLNSLTYQHFGTSFNELCLSAFQDIQATPRVSSRLQEIDPVLEIRRQSAFICYSHKDERYLNELRTHLAYYVRAGTVDYWDDTKIPPGSKWREEIQEASQGAKVVILLISADFFASDFIMQNELPLLLDAVEHKAKTVFCVILRPCLFKDTDLARFQAVNNPSQPLSSMSYEKREKIWIRVAELVRDGLQIHN